ncbi:MAG TPA: DUF349 domain-containing protein [Paludibacter sp.]|nr:DUF349 domain-containing protein [Paludibacter sp.]
MSPLDLNKETEIVQSEKSRTTEMSDIQPVSTQEEAIQPAETAPEEETVVAETSGMPAIEPGKSEPAQADYAAKTKSELIDSLKLLIDKDMDTIKDEVELIKQQFYKKIKVEAEEQKKAFTDEGHDESEFVPAKDESEETFKSLLNEYRARKASRMAFLEKQKEENLVQKQHLLEQMKNLVASPEEVSTHINEFRTLQQKWKETGSVPQSASTDLWKQYNAYQESFWDLIKINNELREYDFKKNLETKTQLCETAEKLAAEQDVVQAFQKLQKLHEEWHETGPVAREMREQIWTRFKEASTAIHKKHQTHFETIRKEEEANYEAKKAICEKIESMDLSKFNTFKAWDDATQEMNNFRDEWKTIGFAPRKVNQKIFESYRKACDAFYAAKNEFYKETKNEYAKNAEKKKALCEQAEALKDSTDWKETSEKLIQLQKEWKTVGRVSNKYSDELWKRFISACDYFFENKNKNTSGVRNAEAENLAKKKELISKINDLAVTGNPAESLATLRSLTAEWNSIGHVPFKEKDKIYKEYREAIDKQFDALNVDSSNRRLDNFRTNVKEMSAKGENKLYREREKLVRAYEHLKSEIATYENNIGFFSSNSKKGSGLIHEMERKINTLKEESKVIEKKINLIDETI